MIVAIPLTQRGAVRLDEQARADALVTLLQIASVFPRRKGSDRYATPAELLSFMQVMKRPLKLSVVELPNPSDTPPAGSIGYYSDGALHVAAVVLSASGRRLFFEADVDHVIRSNVLEYLYGDP